MRVPSGAVALLDPVMVRGASGDLRRMSDDQHLALLGKPGEPFADGAGDRAADAAVDLVEDHRRGAPRLSQRDLQREDEARQFAARSDPGQRAERRAGVGRNFEFDAVGSRRAGFGRRDGGAEAGGVELQRRKLRGDGEVQPRCRLMPLIAKRLRCGA